MDTKAWEELLDVAAPWRVVGMEINVAREEVVVRVECEQVEWSNATEQRQHVHGWKKRRWRHLDLWQCHTIIEAEVPRPLNPLTGATEMAVVPWAEGLFRWSKQWGACGTDTDFFTHGIGQMTQLAMNAEQVFRSEETRDNVAAIFFAFLERFRVHGW
jgi:hypothetical protein